MSKPHDSLFKTTFSVPKNATPAFQMFLPEKISALLEIEKPEVEPGSFIDDELVERSTDILYKVPFRHQHGGKKPAMAYIYLLFEHQSTVEKWMSFRLLRYMVRIWEYYLKTNPKAEKLPLIFPLVLYNGESPWSAAMDFHGLMEAPQETLAAFNVYIPQFHYFIESLSKRDTRALLGEAMVRLTIKFMKYIREVHLLDLIPSWSDELEEVYQNDITGLNYFLQIVKYVIENRNFSEEEVVRVFSRIGKNSQEIIMTLAERLRKEGEEKGRDEGLKEGEEKGLKKGEEKGRRQTLLKLIELKFGPPTEATKKNIQTATTEQLECWTAYILTIDSVEDLLQKKP